MVVFSLLPGTTGAEVRKFKEVEPMTRQQAVTLAYKKAKRNPDTEYLVYADLDDYSDGIIYLVCTGDGLPYYIKDSEIVCSTWE